MKITQEHVGKKVKLRDWGENSYVEVLFVGDKEFFAKSCYQDEEWSYVLDDDWELYEGPKKKKKNKKILSPCVWKNFDILEVSSEIFETEKEAKDRAGSDFISWPAMQIIDGKEVPIQIVVEE